MNFELERQERILQDVEKLIYPQSIPVTDYKVFDENRKDGYSCSTTEWRNYQTNEVWGKLKQHRWFRTTITIPKEFDRCCVEFIVTTGREGEWDATNPQMLFYLNGEIIQGVDVNHRHITIAEHAVAGETYEVAFLAYSGSVPGDLVIRTALATKDKVVEHFYYDLSSPITTARVLTLCDAENCRRILQKTSGAVDVLDLRVSYSKEFYHSMEAAEAVLKEEFYTNINEQAPLVSAIGHTHIDIAWLWPVSQTKEKVLRSFSTVLRLMDQHPNYKFMSSQPILYQFVKDQEPAMFEKIKQKVKAGRWEIDGAMWLEADCNIPSGESFVRQIIKGHRFFMDEFGVESKSLWLPDVFGYSAAIPQILKKCGINYFMTTKIAWNETNQLPNDTFRWRGIDQSEVFVFMPTTCEFDQHQGQNISFSEQNHTTTYTGYINPNMLLGTYKRFQNKELTEDTLMLFGYGDGGGGPTAQMLENAERLKYGMPGMPRIKQEFETEFFDRTYQKIAHKPEMPTWDGELYFEYHRGTYTACAKNKRNNRKSEILYEQLETLSTLTQHLGCNYPQKQLQDGWDVILLNQFHDIIPGSCVSEVYQTTDKEYAGIMANGEALAQEQMHNIASHIAMPEPSVLVFNSLGYTRDDIVTVTVPFSVCGVRDDEGNKYTVQYVKENSFLFFAKGIPATGYKAFTLIQGEKPEETKKAPITSFENAWYSVIFDGDCSILSLVEKETETEFIREGERGNELLTYEDRPVNWDNWNIDSFYRKKPYTFDSVSEPKVLEYGPVRFCLEVERKFLSSVITQQIYLYRDIPRIDFENTVDWEQNNVLLRVNFPVDVNATKATFEIQYGNVERETTNNNSWDSAKFEVCGHKWADLSENARGISLLNDCKYGYSVKDGNLSLTLLKAGKYPNTDADMGTHRFTYSIYPHSGRWQDASTIQMAYNLNVPLQSAVCAQTTGTAAREFSLASSSCGNCFIEVMKQAEDGNGTILRIYENKNSKGKTTIRLGFAPQRIFECDLLENNLTEIEHQNHEFEFMLKPFEIKTFRIIFR